MANVANDARTEGPTMVEDC